VIAITGAGAIGQLWAYRFGNEHCYFLDTRHDFVGPKLLSIQTSESNVAEKFGQYSIDSSLFRQPSAVFICTKSYSAFAAAEALDTRLPKHIPFVLFQNGMGSQEQITTHVQDRAIFGATTTSGANIGINGALNLAGRGQTNIGALNQLASSTSILELLPKQTKYSSEIAQQENFEQQLWKKLIINCGINAITAIENCTNGKIQSTKTFKSLWVELTNELCSIADLANLPPETTAIQSLILDVAEQTGSNISSMLQDVRSGKNTEIDDINGLIQNANSTWLIGKPLKQDLERALLRPVALANDADCFTLSEASDGAGITAQCVFGVILGTGVGGGICVNQSIIVGPNAITGEWGHNPMPGSHCRHWKGQHQSIADCYCGKQHCIETYLSGPGFLKHFNAEHGYALGRVEEILNLNDQEISNIAVSQYIDRLGCALAQVVNILDPNVIVLGGGLSNISTIYSELPKVMGRYVFSDDFQTSILPAKFGDASGVRGAAWLGRETAING